MADIEMTNLNRTKEELDAAKEELTRYQAALSSAVADFGDKRRQLRSARDELKNTAVQFYLSEGSHSEDDIAQLNQHIHSLEDAMNTAERTTTGLEREIEQLEQKVAQRRGSVTRMKDLAEGYEKGKRQYPETYARAKADRDRPLLDSRPDATSVIRLRKLRRDLLAWAARLGCEANALKFLASVEGEAKAIEVVRT